MKVWLIRFRGVETPIESVLSEQTNRMLRALRAVSAVQRIGRAVLLASSAESLGVLWMHGKFFCHSRNENIVKQFPSIDALEPLTVNTPNAINAVHMATQRPAVSDLLRGHFAADFSCQPCGPLHC